MHQPTNIAEVQQAVRDLDRVRVRGGGTKPALSADANLSTAGLSRVLEYEPGEYTFTALAGTPVAEVEAMLAEKGQFLPLDPPLSAAGATLGGTLAAGLSGPGRLRFGGVRDFLLGVKLVSGEGREVFGGGKVVKNAAGFDIPKLMIGGCGRFGVMVELTFKVFPRPQKYTTLVVTVDNATEAAKLVARLAMSKHEPAALEYEPPGRVLVRIGGLAAAAERRVARLREFIEQPVEVLEGDADVDLWRRQREFDWSPEAHGLLKIPLSAGQIPTAEKALSAEGSPPRRYSVAGSVLWLAWPPEKNVEAVDDLCGLLARRALPIRGGIAPADPAIPVGNPLLDRLVSVFDPGGKFALADPSLV